MPSPMGKALFSLWGKAGGTEQGITPFYG
jgi:hypothetical protein